MEGYTKKQEIMDIIKNECNWCKIIGLECENTCALYQIKEVLIEGLNEMPIDKQQ